MRRLHLRVVLIVITMGPAAAQTPDSVWSAALARLSPGATIRLQSRDSGRIEGRLVRIQRTTLNFQTGAARAEWSTSVIDSLWVRGRATKTGGGAGGAILGAIVGSLIPKWQRRVP